MEKNHGLGFIGEPFQHGLQKDWFPQIKVAGANLGSGLDSIIVLDERLDLRIRVEATLSHLFNRRIMLEWDSGRLLPKATLGQSGVKYRLDSEECHGIKELLVLLTHLYNDENAFLIIDEPELNLHPQFQAFFMQEVRKVAGDPVDGWHKIVFLVTHSPFVLDFKTMGDLKSVFSFDLDHSPPRHILNLDQAASDRLSGLVPRLNVHHKQLFFSDNPVFVEGIFDAQLVQLLQESRGVSMAAAGSCVIDAGGKTEVTKYLELCIKFGKGAYFLYDLDSLFSGTLRSCIREDATLTDFLALQGIGNDFVRYCGELDRVLTPCIQRIYLLTDCPTALIPLMQYLRALAPLERYDTKIWAKARTALLVQAAKDRACIDSAGLGSELSDALGRLEKIAAILRERNVFLLKSGQLEHYLPAYKGDLFSVSEDAKKSAVDAETAFLSTPRTDIELTARYGELFEAVRSMPAKTPVNVDEVVKTYLSSYVHELQNMVVTQRAWQLAEMQTHLRTFRPGIERLFALVQFERGEGQAFRARITVLGAQGAQPRYLEISNDTNAGMLAFVLPPA
jgi:hypothetical protein